MALGQCGRLMPGHPGNVAAYSTTEYLDQRIAQVAVSLGFPVRPYGGFARSSDEGDGHEATS